MKILTKIIIKYPLAENFHHVMNLCNTWKLKFLSGATTSEEIVVLISLDKFKIFYGENPRKKTYPPINGTESFIEEIQILKVLK